MRQTAILALILLAACGQQPAGKPVERMELGANGKITDLNAPKPTPSAVPVAKVASACQPVTFEQAKLTDCVADPAKDRIAMVLGPKGEAPYRSFAQFAAKRSADASPVVFAMNAGMFDGEGKPIGYYVENGDRLKELNRNDGPGNFHMKPNGVFFGSDGKWQIRTSDDFYHNVGDRPKFGTQSGPMLVIDGKLHPQISQDGPSRTIRDGVGIDPQGRAHFVISDEAVSFGKLARYFRDAVKAKNALYLDGTVSALWDPATGRMDSRAPIGPIVVVSAK
ncbi:phosphodiester glycosidase family protein [Tsuneonella mangrovi]|uniref:phosphodiester glycosidase family protein n=1 Tax=Tsuneonella mangrovi TaxID=1982042 RepID=UPI001F0B6383|nr:phosphodiester glycosidase family protein [Tsuneonella mangrovi]